MSVCFAAMPPPSISRTRTKAGVMKRPSSHRRQHARCNRLRRTRSKKGTTMRAGENMTQTRKEHRTGNRSSTFPSAEPSIRTFSSPAKLVSTPPPPALLALLPATTSRRYHRCGERQHQTQDSLQAFQVQYLPLGAERWRPRLPRGILTLMLSMESPAVAPPALGCRLHQRCRAGLLGLGHPGS